MRYLIILLLFLPFSVFSQKENPLEKVIQTDAQLREICSQPGHQVQIIYTQIDRDTDNHPHFTSFSYGVDTSLYFYPASTVKMPAAFLALEKLNQLAIQGVDRNTSMYTGSARAPQTEVKLDSSAQDLRPTIGQYIKKIFLVSDNDAYNRLYEFLGQAYLNRKLREKGYNHSRIIHRLSVSGFDVEGNRHTNPVSFVDAKDTLLYYQGAVYSNGYPEDVVLNKQLRGMGYTTNEGVLVEAPFDFTHKNYVSLQDLHDMLQAVLFPQAVPARRRFDLTDDDYDFLYQYMQMLPRESSHPAYPALADWDSYVKFVLFGSERGVAIPDHLRLLNKVGDAYGFLTDVAYVVDYQSGTEFLLAVNLHVNANQIYNDGVYEYEETGFPFMKRLGELLYAHEAKRSKRRKPDLSRFKK